MNRSSINIEGNWYTKNQDLLMIEDQDELNLYYEELYLTNRNIFSFSNIQGFLPPYSYKVSNDSLYISLGLNEKSYVFRGEIKMIDKNSYVLVNSERKRDTFFRLMKVKNTLDKFLKRKDSIVNFHQNRTEFTQGFINRTEKIIKN